MRGREREGAYGRREAGRGRGREVFLALTVGIHLCTACVSSSITPQNFSVAMCDWKGACVSKDLISGACETDRLYI